VDNAVGLLRGLQRVAVLYSIDTKLAQSRLDKHGILLQAIRVTPIVEENYTGACHLFTTIDRVFRQQCRQTEILES